MKKILSIIVLLFAFYAYSNAQKIVVSEMTWYSQGSESTQTSIIPNPFPPLYFDQIVVAGHSYFVYLDREPNLPPIYTPPGQPQLMYAYIWNVYGAGLNYKDIGANGTGFTVPANAQIGDRISISVSVYTYQFYTTVTVGHPLVIKLPDDGDELPIFPRLKE